MNYTHGQTALRAKAVAKTSDEVRAELDHLNRLRATILAETAAKEKELTRIRAARKRLQPVATYQPTLEALAYREQHGHIIAAQPAPMHGGKKGIEAAANEADGWWARKKEMAG